MKYWPEQLYLPDPVVDRLNRENWMRSGSKRLTERATAAVEESLAAYRPVETDPRLVDELQAIIRSGMKTDGALPLVPDAMAPLADLTDGTSGRRRRRRSGR
jgi:hypothetical protein